MCQVTLLNTNPREAFSLSIINNSNSNNYTEAIKEWQEILSGPFAKGTYSYCICGQLITNGSFIINKATQKLLIIGYNCRDKYISNIDNVSRKLVAWLYKKNYINDWENQFLRSLSTKTGNYSEKQKLIYSKINIRILKILINKYSL